MNNTESWGEIPLGLGCYQQPETLYQKKKEVRGSTYEKMWDELGLDIPADDNLLKVLGSFYGDIYLSQEGRLKGVEYLDFVVSEIHGLRISRTAWRPLWK